MQSLLSYQCIPKVCSNRDYYVCINFSAAQKVHNLCKNILRTVDTSSVHLKVYLAHVYLHLKFKMNVLFSLIYSPFVRSYSGSFLCILQVVLSVLFSQILNTYYTLSTHLHASVKKFPAAATTSIPLSTASLIASVITWLCPPINDKLMIALVLCEDFCFCCTCLTTWYIPCVASDRCE